MPWLAAAPKTPSPPLEDSWVAIAALERPAWCLQPRRACPAPRRSAAPPGGRHPPKQAQVAPL
eukprot:15464437-Alexandrium_andersonii.AAC.1